MKAFAYFACGLLMPFVVSIFISCLPIVFAAAGIKGLLYQLLLATAILISLLGAILLQRVLRIYAEISYKTAKKIIVYGGAIAWWVISIFAVGINIAALLTLSRVKIDLAQKIRLCWIASRLSGTKDPTYSTLSEVFPEKKSRYPRHQSTFHILKDPRTNTIITSEEAAKSSCFDIYATPMPLASTLAPSLRATLPDRTDESSSVFQNMTESIILKGKDLKNRPWNRIKPEDKNILRTCSSPLGIGCDESLNSQGQAW